jgi:hypothetical protein
MSDNATPHKPASHRINHLQAEPVPISFASPQQIAAFTAGGGFNNLRMKSPMSPFMSPMNTGYSMNNANYQVETVQPKSPSTTGAAAAVAAAAAASTSSKSASSDSNVIKPLPPQPIDLSTFKGFKFVTLDGLQLETRDIYDKISGTFKWEMCESQDDRCIHVIREECENRRVFLVSSGSLGAKIVPQIHDLPQVYAIYIYCANVKYHSEWASKYEKVRVVCDNDDLHLLPKFAVDVAQSNIDWGNAFLKQGARDKAKEKFKLAYDKINDHARNHDPAMAVEIKNKLEECK